MCPDGFSGPRQLQQRRICDPQLLKRSVAAEHAVDLAAVHAGYGRRPVLDDVSLRIHDGITVVVGPNGGGKSTLLKVIATLVRPTSGTVRVFGRDPHRGAGRRQVRRTIGYLEQNARFPPELRVIDCLRYAAWLLRVPARRTRRGGRPLPVGFRSGRRRRRPDRHVVRRHLSAGDAGRGIDPPTGDCWCSTNRRQVSIPFIGRRSSRLLGDAAPTVVVSTHHLDDIVAFADRVVVVADGRVGFDGSLADLEAIGELGSDRMRTIQSALAALGGARLVRSVAPLTWRHRPASVVSAPLSPAWWCDRRR